MRIGVLMLPTDPWPEAVERARRLESLGFDHLWTYDHLSWRTYRGRPWHSAIPWLTGLAATTGHIGLGTMVVSPHLRNPVTLAQDAVTLDHVSGGRLLLGVGTGGPGFDATVLGAEPLSPGALTDRLAEFVGLLDRLWREPAVSHEGAYYSVTDAVVQPACLQEPRVPIAIAAGGPRTIALAARLGDAWITYADSTTLRSGAGTAALRAQAQQLDDACGAIGRDPSSIRRIFLTGTAPAPLWTSAAVFHDVAARIADLGFTDLVFHHPHTADPTRRERDEIIEEIASEVLPHFQS